MNIFFSWGKRNLTILGKIMIIKALVIPIFTFVASACVVPDKYRKEIESKCCIRYSLKISTNSYQIV
jgi:hypothetical protein